MPKDILFERSKIKMPVYKIIQKIIFLFLNITFFSHITYVLRFMFQRHARIHNSVPGVGGGGVPRQDMKFVLSYISLRALSKYSLEFPI